MQTQAQKQALIGELIAGVVIKQGSKVIGKAVKKGLEKVAERPDIVVSDVDVKKAEPVVTNQVEAAVVREAQAQAEHKFDAEPHWQSRNIWGAFVAFIGAVDVIYRLWTDDQLNTPSDYLGPIGVVLGILTPLYSRFIAKKPLFR
jgi:hypothetical protein